MPEPQPNLADANAETIEVLPQHRFPVPPLEAWLAGALPEIGRLVEIRQFRSGQSNPTFLLNATGGRFVLRKKPPGALLRSAHRIEREFRVMEALRKSPVPVAQMLVYCADETVIGTEFFIMSFVSGRQDRNPAMPGFPLSQRRPASIALARVLAAVHDIDLERYKLTDFSRSRDYLDSQIATWAKQYAVSKTADIPAMDELPRWLAGNRPPPHAPCLVHGDFRPGNVIFDQHAPEVITVLDWELSSIGHPQADLAYMLMPYHLPAGVPGMRGLQGIDLASAGLPSLDDVVAAYVASRPGVGVEDLSYFLAFSMFRLAAILQGVYARSLAGNASSPDAETFGTAVGVLADRALDLTRTSGAAT